jgi:hypothetical protein
VQPPHNASRLRGFHDVRAGGVASISRVLLLPLYNGMARATKEARNNTSQHPTESHALHLHSSFPTDNPSSHLFYDASSSIYSPDTGTGCNLCARMGSFKRRPRTAGPAAPASVPVHSFSIALCIHPIDRARASVKASACKTLYVVSAQIQLSNAASTRSATE